MRVLVTGATGNIGQSAVKALLDRGHQVRAMIYGTPSALSPAFNQPQLERFPCDIRDADCVNEAVVDQDVIVHLAFVIPPLSNEKPDLARAVNLDGTRNLIDAARRQPIPPRFLFASTLDLFGHTSHLQPPRHLTDPVEATDLYTEHKLQCEQWVQDSGLQWCNFRFSDVPVIGFRPPHPLMYEIPLDQRLEVLHTLDSGLAIANAVDCDDVWGHTWLIGGGKDCQLTYRQFLFGLFSVMGIGDLPESAFTTQPYVTDWLDSSDSEALLHYQKHTFADILHEVELKSGLQRRFIPFVRPLVVRFLLRMSPYFSKS